MTGGLGWFAGSARADGDPASDVLATQALFLPQDAGIPTPRQVQLAGLMQAASRSGYPIRVALIASATDLGSITELWRQPSAYARFLGEELSLTYHGVLLVVMPNGFGVYDQGRSTAGLQTALAGVTIYPIGARLGATTLTAVQRIAAAAGHPLAIPPTRAVGASGSVEIVPWIVFAAGLVLIALAWTASVRARPLREPRGA